jgi:hypothetical protein
MTCPLFPKNAQCHSQNQLFASLSKFNLNANRPGQALFEEKEPESGRTLLTGRACMRIKKQMLPTPHTNLFFFGGENVFVTCNYQSDSEEDPVAVLSCQRIFFPCVVRRS